MLAVCCDIESLDSCKCRCTASGCVSRYLVRRGEATQGMGGGSVTKIFVNNLVVSVIRDAAQVSLGGMDLLSLTLFISLAET